MKKRILCILLSTACVLSACTTEKPEEKKPVEEEEEEEEEVPTPTEAPEEKEVPIEIGYRGNSCEFHSGDVVMAYGGYTTIEINDKAKEAYPKLQAYLEGFNKREEEDILQFFDYSEEELLSWFATGADIPYERNHIAQPVRADAKAFSLCVTDYVYYAGAHGVTSWRGINVDPVTGEEIRFDQVFADTSDLPQIIYDELLKQNSDLESYFANDASSKDALMDSLENTRLSDEGRFIAWALDTEGVWFYFEDYAMGTYAAGARSLEVLYADYPEIFHEEYFTGNTSTGIEQRATPLREGPVNVVESDKEIPYQKEEEFDYKITNPGKDAYVAAGLSKDAGKAGIRIKEKSHEDEVYEPNHKEWAERRGLDLLVLPYSDDDWTYEAENKADEEGRLILTVTGTGDDRIKYVLDLSDFAVDPDRDSSDVFGELAEQQIRFAAMDESGETLYISIGHSTYASTSPNTSYIIAVDVSSGELLWRSDNLVAKADNFIIEGSTIISGYGFSNEADFIYLLNKENGKVQEKIGVSNAPYCFVKQGNELIVLHYGKEVTYTIE
ncbi:MAG: RsiV family protein [Lachnospiraceae bacterium]|nr:RsiV family protein [Lachnospiraceae bacterium]